MRLPPAYVSREHLSYVCVVAITAVIASSAGSEPIVCRLSNRACTKVCVITPSPSLQPMAWYSQHYGWQFILRGEADMDIVNHVR